MSFSEARDERHEKKDRRTELKEKKELAEEAEAEACEIYRKRDEDIPPEPGNPNFWPSTSLHIEEDFEPPSRNKPDGSPWCEIKEADKGEVQEANTGEMQASESQAAEVKEIETGKADEDNEYGGSTQHPKVEQPERGEE